VTQFCCSRPWIHTSGSQLWWIQEPHSQLELAPLFYLLFPPSPPPLHLLILLVTIIILDQVSHFNLFLWQYCLFVPWSNNVIVYYCICIIIIVSHIHNQFFSPIPIQADHHQQQQWQLHPRRHLHSNWLRPDSYVAETVADISVHYLSPCFCNASDGIQQCHGVILLLLDAFYHSQ